MWRWRAPMGGRYNKIEAGVVMSKGHSFVIGQVDNGKWLAVSSHSPYFCFEGESEAELCDIANRALDFYFRGGVALGHERQRINLT